MIEEISERIRHYRHLKRKAVNEGRVSDASIFDMILRELSLLYQTAVAAAR